MNGNLLWDTTIAVALFRDDSAVRERLRLHTGVLVSAVVLGELYFGAQKSTRFDKHLRQINRFLTRVAVIEVNAETAYEYGQIKNELRAKGRPIPDNDIWIAAAAKQHNLTLVSRDGHFADVNDLRWEQW